MGREEQIEEREVLDSIFPDEITGESYPAWFMYDSSVLMTCPCIRYLRDILPRLDSTGCVRSR